MKSYTFYKIDVPDADKGQVWASRMGNIYGFEFDHHQTTDDTVLAWAIDDEKLLEMSLQDDDIRYSKFQVKDLVSFFSL